jgi:hypothetical protein
MKCRELETISISAKVPTATKERLKEIARENQSNVNSVLQGLIINYVNHYDTGAKNK